ncbi:MAG: DUF523 and DUF1722 domain-containing protein [Thermoflexales bacterium]|nr:DUF523 and DUF1722 domain-containing protein [Thermoflexales bacterium]
MPKPRLVVSKCLGFDACRYDGSVIPDPVVDSLREWAEFLPICPEMELGLGAPRPPVRLVRVGGEVRLLQPATGRDLTEEMRAFAASFLDSLPPVDGFVLKNRSPSCGIKDAKVYAGPEKAPALGVGPGMFGEAVRARFPDLPVEDEGRLTNRALREHFYTAIFAPASLREVVDSGQMGALVDLHTRNKFLLMAYNQARMRELGRVVANPGRRPVGEVMAEYAAGFRAALARPPRRPAVVNVLMHALGYLSDHLTPAEKGYFLDLLAAYREGRQPLSTPVGVLRAWILRTQQPYLSAQTFFPPFPEALVSLRDSGRTEG